MLVKGLGTVDIFIGLVFIVLATPTIVAREVLFLCVGILSMKGLIGALKEIGGWIDFSGAGLLALSFIFSIPSGIFLIMSFLLLQKGILSIF